MSALLVSERHQRILNLLAQKENISLQELVENLDTSESTIRRDLSQLEKENQLRRVHGGASLVHQARSELSMQEKSAIHLNEKKEIAAYAAGLIQEGDCIFLDAGTSTYEMITHLQAKNLIVVTNGLPHLEALFEKEIDTYLLGGFLKRKTKAIIGRAAQEAIKQYRFDKCFIGVNGIHPDYGFTTPDPEEAAIKNMAIESAQKAYALADYTKFYDVSFAKIADLNKASIITNKNNKVRLSPFKGLTKLIIAN